MAPHALCVDVCRRLVSSDLALTPSPVFLHYEHYSADLSPYGRRWYYPQICGLQSLPAHESTALPWPLYAEGWCCDLRRPICREDVYHFWAMAWRSQNVNQESIFPPSVLGKAVPRWNFVSQGPWVTRWVEICSQFTQNTQSNQK